MCLHIARSLSNNRFSMLPPIAMPCSHHSYIGGRHGRVVVFTRLLSLSLSHTPSPICSSNIPPEPPNQSAFIS
ncbi:unnamed protein product [Periconia digitata]|uniref:Uncharacterized protein n=1 Tax=Periconia digitata TaxID=1303443 RepID=A0A9W4U3Y2_9PLEO|nr:unnamed protein product [Periconia digitata]